MFKGLENWANTCFTSQHPARAFTFPTIRHGEIRSIGLEGCRVCLLKPWQSHPSHCVVMKDASIRTTAIREWHSSIIDVFKLSLERMFLFCMINSKEQTYSRVITKSGQVLGVKESSDVNYWNPLTKHSLYNLKEQELVIHSVMCS